MWVPNTAGPSLAARGGGGGGRAGTRPAPTQYQHHRHQLLLLFPSEVRLASVSREVM